MKLRKTLGTIQDEEIITLMHLIETQSSYTITKWCTDYAKEIYLPIFNKYYSCNALIPALDAACSYTRKEISKKEARSIIKEADEAIIMAKDNPVALSAARAITQACASCYTPTCSLGMVFYGLACVVYDKVGLNEESSYYDELAKEEGQNLINALKKIYKDHEENPAKINWNC